MMETKPALLPELWLDWCEVTGTALEAHRDPATMRRFTLQAQPSQLVLGRLLPRYGSTPVPVAAPAWPPAHRDDPESLCHVLRHVTSQVNQPSTDWIWRLRLRRLAFAAVLVAPNQAGGLALDRQQAVGLHPVGLVRPTPAGHPAACPACAVWWWLHVVGTNAAWSHSSVRALAHETGSGDREAHVCELPDPSPDWVTCPALLPAIDQWGYVNPYSALHVSSLSVLLRAIAGLLQQPVPTPAPPPAAPPSARPTREFTAEEERAVLDRADEVNRRVARILAELS